MLVINGIPRVSFTALRHPPADRWTREQFEADWVRNTGVLLDELRKHGYGPVPCHGCLYNSCQGWSMGAENMLSAACRST